MIYIKRILVLPFVFGILLVTYIFHLFNRCRLFLLYGGEWLEYIKDDKVTIQQIYLRLKEYEKAKKQNKGC